MDRRLKAPRAHWPARSAWRLSDDLAAIRAVGEHKEVEIEVGKRGRGYLDPDFQRINMGLGAWSGRSDKWSAAER